MKKGESIWRKKFVLVVLSAFFSALPYNFPSLFFLSWFSFAPLFCVLSKRENTLRKDLGLSCLFGVLYYLFIYWWFSMLYPMELTNLSKTAAISLTVLACVGPSVLHGTLFFFMGAGMHCVKKTCRSLPVYAMVFLSTFLLSEWILQFGELAFPWIRISVGQFRCPVLLQGASLVGTYGTDLLILSCNVLLALVFLSHGNRKIMAGVLAVILFLGNLGFGLLRQPELEDFEKKITVSSVQGNFLSGEKWKKSNTQNCIDTQMDLTRKTFHSSPDLVVWAESAVPVTLNSKSSQKILSSFQTLSEEGNTSILMGALWNLEGKQANTAVMIQPHTVSAPYVKRHLTPFGETMPYRSFFENCFPFLTKINLLSEDLVEGKGSGLIKTGKGNIGCIICFESIFPNLVRQSTIDGAEILVEVTNDSWYKDSPEVYQHLGHAVLRSIENGRDMVRAANSGVSALIDARGRITEELGPLQRGVITGVLHFSKERTLYSVIGDIGLPIFVGITIFCWGFLALWEKRKNII